MHSLKKWFRNYPTMRRINNFLKPTHDLGIDSFLINCRSILHIGANNGAERFLYERLDLRVTWIEALPDVHAELTKNLRGFKKQNAVLALISSHSGEKVIFNVAGNEGASSSIFEFSMHAKMWPDVKMTGAIELESKRLDDVIETEYKVDALVIDTQGAELVVLHGGPNVLKNVKYVKAEAADFDAYRGGCTLDELSNFMIANGFAETQRHLFASKEGLGNYYDVLWQRASSSGAEASK